MDTEFVDGHSLYAASSGESGYGDSCSEAGSPFPDGCSSQDSPVGIEQCTPSPTQIAQQVSRQEVEEPASACNRKLNFSQRKKKPNPKSVARRNARERNRIRTINSTFALLKQCLPDSKIRRRRVSKVDILRYATEYISELAFELYAEGSSQHLEQCSGPCETAYPWSSMPDSDNAFLLGFCNNSSNASAYDGVCPPTSPGSAINMDSEILNTTLTSYSQVTSDLSIETGCSTAAAAYENSGVHSTWFHQQQNHWSSEAFSGFS